MLKRITYGLLVGSAVIFVILCLPKYVSNILVALIALGGVYEFNVAMRAGGYNPLKLIPYASCGALLFIRSSTSIVDYKFSAAMFAIVVLALLIYALFLTNRTLVDACLSFFSMLYIPFLLSFLLSTYYIENVGYQAIWLILFGACGTDIFAYFIGVNFGKHKLCPKISPNKTIEGSVGGVIGACLIFLSYAAVLNKWGGFDIQYWKITAFAVIVSVFSEIGDLVASSIKRFIGTKDFGSCLPGHGGILDRIDSILFAAPIIYYYLLIFPEIFR